MYTHVCTCTLWSVCLACAQLNFDIAERIRSGLSNLDESLEGVGVLPKLDPPPPLSQAQLAEFDVVSPSFPVACGEVGLFLWDSFV
eukprot:1149234-Pelagomonas_calceolata.AAC.5